MSTVKKCLIYASMFGVTLGALLWIGAAGADLVAQNEGSNLRFPREVSDAAPHTFLRVGLALLVVILAARALGAAFKYLKQPPVMGEIIAGILLGPTFLGTSFPSVSAELLSPSVKSYLGLLGQLGIVFYMFMVGLELDTGVLRKKAGVTLAVSHASITAPLVLGAGIALWIYPILSSRDVPFFTFALFMGVSMSVTAFPVLARILTDRGLQRTPLGVIAMGCAAVDDVSAWCLLSALVGIAQSDLGGSLQTCGLSLAYVAIVLGVVRPLVTRVALKTDRNRHLPTSTIYVFLIGIFASSLTTEYIGIHAVFGAFLLGVIVPHDSLLAKSLRSRLEDMVLVILLPAFFASTGARFDLSLIDGASDWAMCGAIVAIACLGKFGGSAFAARLSGMSFRDSVSLGLLMNTRGLMELIVLNIGLELGVISPTLFAMLVVMALVTTIGASPLIHWLTRQAPQYSPETGVTQIS